jgi:predicted nucleotidyltransferase
MTEKERAVLAAQERAKKEERNVSIFVSITKPDLYFIVPTHYNFKDKDTKLVGEVRHGTHPSSAEVGTTTQDGDGLQSEGEREGS